mmetsp:Transcript_127194/g.231114  ORF Transcript_127194/g.231114 Transcript_127194/m.231114 type:complete len:221 (+) Transcript_127194:509-1171(+)
MVVAHGLDDFWGEIIWGTAGGVRLPHNNLGETHVSKLHVASLRQKEILWLQVSVNDFLLVKMLEGEDDPRNIELGVRLTPMKIVLVVRRIQFTSEGQLQEKVQRLAAVVSLMQLDDEGRIAHVLDVLLADHCFLHSTLYNIAFAQRFHCVGLLGHRMLYKHYGSEASASQEPQLCEVLPQDVVATVHRRAFLVIHGTNLTPAAFSASLLDRLKGAKQHLE